MYKWIIFIYIYTITNNQHIDHWDFDADWLMTRSDPASPARFACSSGGRPSARAAAAAATPTPTAYVDTWREPKRTDGDGVIVEINCELPNLTGKPSLGIIDMFHIYEITNLFYQPHFSRLRVLVEKNIEICIE